VHPRRIGRYEVVGEIGRGGMGVVYRARDTELERFVALKSLPTDRTTDPARRRRFLQEARSASALSHPNIITVHDVISENGEDWIVMELVEGTSLQELIPEGGLPLGQALPWAVEIADALATAHAAGIIHRDIKPGNVMIDRAGRSRVLDFGLAKLQASVEPPEPSTTVPTLDTPLTRAGTVLGTLEYMSPEQAMGQPVDGRSDVFSFGAVLYQMVTGRAPFSGANAPSIIHAVVYERQAPLESWRPELPSGLSTIVERALAKEPQDRFPTIAAMRDALREVELAPDAPRAGKRRGAGLPATVAWPKPPRPVPGRARGRASLGRAAAVGLGIAALLTASWWGLGRWQGPGGGAATAPALPQTAFQLLQEAQGLLDHYWRSGYLDQATDSLQRAVDADSAYAPAYAALAETAFRRYESERDTIWLDRAAAQANQALRLDGNLTSARLWLGFVLKAHGDLEGAQEAFREVVLLDPANPQAYRGLADVAATRGGLEAAEELYRKAIDRAPGSPELYSAWGTFLFDAGLYEEAAQAFDQATTAAPDFVFGYRNAAAAHHMLGRYDRAAELLQQALEIRPDAPTYSNLGTLYFFQGLYRHALTAYQRAIELGANDYVIWGNLADAYRQAPGHEADAQRAYTRALQLIDESIAGSPGEPTLESRKALLLAKRGSADEASELADRVSLVATDPSSFYRLGTAYELAGRREQALASLAAALERGFSESQIRQNPDLTPLRADPRFHLMLVELAAPQ
jgi:eukaryotic-like serine/threonine-protein kinase